MRSVLGGKDLKRGVRAELACSRSPRREPPLFSFLCYGRSGRAPLSFVHLSLGLGLKGAVRWVQPEYADDRQKDSLGAAEEGLWRPGVTLGSQGLDSGSVAEQM